MEESEEFGFISCWMDSNGAGGLGVGLQDPPSDSCDVMIVLGPFLIRRKNNKITDGRFVFKNVRPQAAPPNQRLTKCATLGIVLSLNIGRI
jgi:hypothetical protein